VGFAQQFAAPGGTTVWWAAFEQAWHKMTEAGAQDLVLAS
jgi:hypothetical protein